MKIDLTNNKQIPEYLIDLLNLLTSNEKVTKLDLYNKNLRVPQCRYLTEILSMSDVCLTEVNLGGNALEDEAVQYIVQLLTNNKVECFILIFSSNFFFLCLLDIN